MLKDRILDVLIIFVFWYFQWKKFFLITVVKDAIRNVLLLLCMDIAMNQSHYRKSEMMAVFCVVCLKSEVFRVLSCFFLLASQTQ
jgi:hypothetical protein